MRFIVFISCFLSIPISAVSQIKKTVYFENNKTKTQHSSLTSLQSYIGQYAESIDSIVFIGYADTLGNALKNKKLSMKRAEYLKSEIFKHNQFQCKTRVVGKGESSKGRIESNRKVDLIIYTSFKALETEAKDSIVELVDQSSDTCVTIDHVFINSSNVQTFNKRNETFILIESEYPYDLNLKNYKYAIRNKDGTLKIFKVKWKNKTTGSLWWAKKRQITYIPEEAYNLYKIFRTNASPCNSCNSNAPNYRADSILIESAMINSNYQVKKVLLSKNTFKIRVPKKFINPSTIYYIGMKKVTWKTQSNGQYLYTKTKIIPNYYGVNNKPKFSNFSPNCNLYGKYTFVRNPKNMLWHMMCGGLRNMGTRTQLNYETGMYKLNKTYIPYLAYIKTLRHESRDLNFYLLFGATYIDKVNLYISTRAKYQIHNKAIIPYRFSSKWSQITNVNYTYELQTNLGLEVSRSFTKEINLIQYYPHLELNLFNNDYGLIESYFFKAGIQTQYIQTEFRGNMMLQTGIKFNLVI